MPSARPSRGWNPRTTCSKLPDLRVAVSAARGSVRAIVTDIEGTTSSIDFVHRELFPYARARLRGFLRAHAQDAAVREQWPALEATAGRSLSVEAAADELEHWIDEDRKVTPLKALQGMIWAQGYAEGALRGHVYPEVADWLRQWSAQGLRLYVYSSGSEEAQRLIFGHSQAGDLTKFFSGYFDTRIGGKREVSSYQRIGEQLSLPASEILFLSDIGEELDAAQGAGLRTCQLLRDPRTVPFANHPQAADFSQVRLD